MAVRLPPPGLAPVLLVALPALLAGCDGNDAPDDVVQHPRAPEIARIVAAEQALANVELAKLDPATMNDAEIRQAIGTGPFCLFRYTSSGKPVLAVGAQPNGAPLGAVVKLNGNLVRLDATGAEGTGGTADSLRLAAGPMRIMVTPDPGEGGDEADRVRRREADMVFEVGESLRAGYRGYLRCGTHLIDQRPGQRGR
jgi:hypothetical protein